jgi:hypothetical protein
MGQPKEKNDWPLLLRRGEVKQILGIGEHLFRKYVDTSVITPRRRTRFDEATGKRVPVGHARYSRDEIFGLVKGT